MPPKFGTSGLRGLVTELTPDLVSDHVRAFLSACDTGAALHVGHDLRDSSPALARVVADTAVTLGHDVVVCGAVPTPSRITGVRIVTRRLPEICPTGPMPPTTATP